ncbi:integrase arm-type DNA-binding domain-containing protein [Thorsellia kenyensis]|uniref:Integrase arm-type DNA-binding domain-containing protein n=1 Tax=Thorsellia kenyensis TaxID=1549888 RepID=A0ABV6CCS8_9GAMM
MERIIRPLTDTEINQSKPKAKDYILIYGKGLELLIRMTGTKTWRFRFLVPATKKAVISIGNYPTIYVFPNRSDITKHMSNSALKNNGLKGKMQAHGMRALASTILKDYGFSLI